MTGESLRHCYRVRQERKEPFRLLNCQAKRHTVVDSDDDTTAWFWSSVYQRHAPTVHHDFVTLEWTDELDAGRARLGNGKFHVENDTRGARPVLDLERKRPTMTHMPKQSDDLTRKGDDVQKTPKAKLKIPVPTKDQISSALRKASQKDETPRPESPDPEKQ